MATKRREADLASLKAANDLAAERLRALKLRAQERAARQMLRPVKRSDRYETATRTRIRPGPTPSGGSADRHLTASVRGRLSRDAQDLLRNSSVARIVTARAQQLLVADGPIVTATTGDEAWDAEADRLWNMYTEGEDFETLGHPHLQRRLSFSEILASIVAAWCMDGDILAVKTTLGSIQLIESERIITPGSPYGMPKELPGGRKIVDGVETDEAGIPLRYHVAEWSVRGMLRSEKTRSVASEYAALLTNPICLRAGFTRGEPALQAVVSRIERLEQYDIKTAIAAELATCFAAIHHSEDPAGAQTGWEAGAEQSISQPSNPDAPRSIDIEPGQITFLGERGKVTALKPEFPTTSFREYVLYQIMMVSAEIGLPLVASMYDSSGLSWSNIKAMLNLSMRSYEPAQSRLARFVRWVRNWKIEEWMAAGYLTPRDDSSKCEIVMPRAPVVDFASEVAGYRNAIESRLMTHDQATQHLGSGRFEDVAKKLAAEMQILRELEIPSMSTPGSKADAPETGKAQGSQEQEDEDDEKEPAGGEVGGEDENQDE